MPNGRPKLIDLNDIEIQRARIRMARIASPERRAEYLRTVARVAREQAARLEVEADELLSA